MTVVNPQNATLDYERLMQSLEIIRKHQGIESQSKLAETIGIDAGVLYRLRKGEGITFDAMLKIIAWSKIDLLDYIVENGAPATE